MNRQDWREAWQMLRLLPLALCAAAWTWAVFIGVYSIGEMVLCGWLPYADFWCF